MECGLFPLFEAEHGRVVDSYKIRRKVPVKDYLRTQKRFAHLFRPEREDTERIAQLQRMADFNIERFDLMEHEEQT